VTTYNEARMSTFLLYFKGNLGHNWHGWLLVGLLGLLFVGGSGVGVADIFCVILWSWLDPNTSVFSASLETDKRTGHKLTLSIHRTQSLLFNTLNEKDSTSSIQKWTILAVASNKKGLFSWIASNVI
jgi:hypothetical protein